MLKKGDNVSKSWSQWRRRRKCILASNATRAALPGANTPCSVRKHACGKQQGVVYFLFCFPTKKAKYRTSTVWMLIYIQWDSHPLSLEQTLKSSLQKVTCASIFQLWNASFPAQAFRITVRLGAFSGGGRERGSYLFIQVSVKLLLTCDTMQGLLALPAGWRGNHTPLTRMSLKH